MNQDTQDIIIACANASNNGTAHFGQVVAELLRAGVESYHADYRAKRTTYYLPEGPPFSLDLPSGDVEIATAFDAESVQAAIRGAQRGEVMYPEFKRLSQAAGCIGYVVWLTGRKVDYFGRNGEVHTELFPS